MFTLDGSHMRKYVLQLDQKMPTCLHSWGSPADPCPCTCRAEPFSEALIKSRGIYAVVVPIPSTTGEPQYRHLHPAELAVLNGLVPPDVWTSSRSPITASVSLWRWDSWLLPCKRCGLGHVFALSCCIGLGYLHQR